VRYFGNVLKLKTLRREIDRFLTEAFRGLLEMETLAEVLGS
jgi:hypothetical protein